MLPLDKNRSRVKEKVYLVVKKNKIKMVYFDPSCRRGVSKRPLQCDACFFLNLRNSRAARLRGIASSFIYLFITT